MRKISVLILAAVIVLGGCIRKDDLSWVREAVQEFRDSDVTIAYEEGVVKNGEKEESIDKTTAVWDAKENAGYEKMEYIGTLSEMYTYYQKNGEKVQSYNGMPDENGEIEYYAGKEFEAEELKLACQPEIAEDAELKHEGIVKEDGEEYIKIKVTETMEKSYTDRMIEMGVIDKEAMEKDSEAKKVLEKGETDQKVYYLWLEAKTHELYKKQEDSTIQMQLLYYAAKSTGQEAVMEYPESAFYVTRYERDKEYEKIEKPAM